MTSSPVAPPKRAFQSVHDFPIVTELDRLKAEIAIPGIPYGDPYSIAEVSNDRSNASTHIRRNCERALRRLDRDDFDIGGSMLDGRDIPGNHHRSGQAVRQSLRAGAMPIILGGDRAIQILRAFEGRGRSGWSRSPPISTGATASTVPIMACPA